MTIEWRTIGFPDHLLRVSEATMRLTNIQITSGSQIANFVRATGLIAQRWTGKFEIATMTREQWQEWEAFIASLSGQAVLFIVNLVGQDLPLGAHAGFDPDGPLYSITGTTITGVTIREGGVSGLVIEDAPRYAQAILVDFGEDMGDQVVLKAGDKFGLGGNLYIVIGDVTTDADGFARVAFRWRLHRAAFVGDVVSFYKPTCRVMLGSGADGELTVTPPALGRASISFIEVPFT